MRYTGGMKEYILYFLAGGAVTALIVGLERSGWRLLSGLATLVPVFTLVSYVFIGEARGGAAVGQHAWLVLLGTLAAWVPYMIAVAVLAPRLGPRAAIPIGFAVFLVCAVAYMTAVDRYRLFR